MYSVLKNASIDELIDITHKDKTWIEKKTYFTKENQIMDIENNYDYYSDLLYLMEKM
ncbi:MAG: hypothetical protein PHX04_03370 [Bacilli bacterium]|nr:hypothetical protein [Bacilli bacterium]